MYRQTAPVDVEKYLCAHISVLRMSSGRVWTERERECVDFGP